MSNANFGDVLHSNRKWHILSIRTCRNKRKTCSVVGQCDMAGPTLLKSHKDGQRQTSNTSTLHIRHAFQLHLNIFRGTQCHRAVRPNSNPNNVMKFQYFSYWSTYSALHYTVSLVSLSTVVCANTE